MLHAEQRAEHVGVEGGRVAFGGLIRDRARLALGACGIDGGVDPAKARNGLVDQIAHVVLVAHVGTDERRFGAEAAECGLQRLAFGFPAARRDDVCAILGKGERGGSADPGQSAGDQYDWVAHAPVPYDFGASAGGAWKARPGSRQGATGVSAGMLLSSLSRNP